MTLLEVFTLIVFAMFFLILAYVVSGAITQGVIREDQSSVSNERNVIKKKVREPSCVVCDDTRRILMPGGMECTPCPKCFPKRHQDYMLKRESE